MPQQEDIDVLRKLIERVQQPIIPGISGRPFTFVPEGSRIEGLESYLRYPTRKIGTPSFTRADSFTAYVNDHKTPASRLYVVSQAAVKVIIDHHVASGDQAGWGQHVAHFSLTQTPEWTTWKTSNGKQMDQRTFAQFIDDNSEDIIGMDGASLLELIRTLKASQKLEITGEVDEKNDVTGTSFTLAAVTKAGVKDGVELPGEFALSVSPYEGGGKIAVRVRLRIEIKAPKFTLSYDLVKIQRVEREALEAIVAGVAKEVEMDAWFGTP